MLAAALFAELGGRYGAPRIDQELRRRGLQTSKKRVAAAESGKPNERPPPIHPTGSAGRIVLALAAAVVVFLILRFLT